MKVTASVKAARHESHRRRESRHHHHESHPLRASRGPKQHLAQWPGPRLRVNPAKILAFIQLVEGSTFVPANPYWIKTPCHSILQNCDEPGSGRNFGRSKIRPKLARNRGWRRRSSEFAVRLISLTQTPRSSPQSTPQRNLPHPTSTPPHRELTRELMLRANRTCVPDRADPAALQDAKPG